MQALDNVTHGIVETRMVHRCSYGGNRPLFYFQIRFMKLSWAEKIVGAILGVLAIASLLLYFFKFHGELSDASSDWSSFANYLSGIWMPLLTICNVWLFYKLTSNVERNTNNRHVEELKHLQKSFKCQLMNDEIIRLIDIVSESFELHKSGKLYDSSKVYRANCYVEAFYRNKQELFPSIVENKKVFDDLQRNLGSLAGTLGGNSRLEGEKIYKDDVLAITKSLQCVLDILNKDFNAESDHALSRE